MHVNGNLNLRVAFGAPQYSRQMRAVGSPLRLEILSTHIAIVFESVGYEDNLHRCRYTSSDVRDVLRKVQHASPCCACCRCITEEGIKMFACHHAIVALLVIIPVR